MEYYERIRELREDNDISQKELSKMLNISQQALSKYETNERKLPIELLKEYAKIFNVSIDYIMGLSDKKEQKTEIRISKNNIEKNYGKITMK